jgi:hypothetical protein
MPSRVEPAKHHAFSAKEDSVEELEVFLCHEHIEFIADSESQLSPPHLPKTEKSLGTGAVLIKYIAEPWERNVQGCLERNQETNHYCPFAMCEEYKYIQCGISKMGMKIYYDNVLKAEYKAQNFPSVNDRDDVQKLLACMPDNQSLGE